MTEVVYCLFFIYLFIYLFVCLFIYYLFIYLFTNSACSISKKKGKKEMTEARNPLFACYLQLWLFLEKANIC